MGMGTHWEARGRPRGGRHVGGHILFSEERTDPGFNIRSILEISTLLRVDENAQRFRITACNYAVVRRRTSINCGSAHVMASPFPPSYTYAYHDAQRHPFNGCYSRISAKDMRV